MNCSDLPFKKKSNKSSGLTTLQAVKVKTEVCLANVSPRQSKKYF